MQRKFAGVSNMSKLYTVSAFFASALAPLTAIVCGIAGTGFLKRHGLLTSYFASDFFCICAVVVFCSIFMGWLWGAFISLPPTFFARYTPPAIPPLLSVFVLNFYLRFVDPRFDFAIIIVLMTYGLWLLFFVGFLLGSRKQKTALGRNKGLRRMAVFLGLCVLLAVLNIYSIMHGTIYWNRENTGSGFEYGEPNSGEYYRPVLLEKAPSLRIAANHPRLCADKVGLPILEAAAQAVYDIEGNREEIDTESGDNMEIHASDVTQFYINRIAFDLLLDGESDIFIGLAPCAKQLEAAEAQGIKLFPIAREALVFLVHKDNPVKELNLRRVRDIYTGKIRRWSDLSGTVAEILAFQQPEYEPDQQVMLSKVMAGEAMTKPLREEYYEASCGLPVCINKIADYRNLPNALGYSFRWKANRRFSSAELCFPAIDGVLPTDENIRSGKYPLTIPIVAAVSPKVTPETAKLLEWLKSAEGQSLIARAGYAPLNPDLGNTRGH